MIPRCRGPNQETEQGACKGAEGLLGKGGTSGSVIAARLAASPARPSVLLLEAGGANEDAAHMTGAERYEVAFREDSPLNWRYETEPQWQGRHLDYSRGKGLGGSTAINFCGWVVGSADDYDEWARRVSDDDNDDDDAAAFGWPNVRRCLHKVENLHVDVPEPYRASIHPQAEREFDMYAPPRRPLPRPV